MAEPDLIDTPGHRLQGRYSIRCAPHVIGVACDALSWVRAAHTLATVQAAKLRLRLDSATPVPAPVPAFMESASALSPFIEEDRALEGELRALATRIAGCDLRRDYRGGPHA